MFVDVYVYIQELVQFELLEISKVVREMEVSLVS